jgi:CheY-like chemotaxis protein
VAPDGQAAMDYLRRSDGTPDVVILDLNLPRKSGREVLEEMSCDLNLRGMPVAILSSSTSQSDVVLREIKQNCVFFSKTADMIAFRKIVTEIHQFALSPRPN